MRSIQRVGVMLLVIAGVSACGGGSSGNNPPPPTSNLQSAPAPSGPLVGTVTLVATDSSGNSWQLLQTLSAGTGSYTWNGNPCSATLGSATISENGVTVITQNTSHFFNTAPYQPLGEDIITTTNQGTVNETFAIVSWNGLPSNLTVGSNGVLDTGNYLAGIPGTTNIGNLTVTYTVSEHDAQSVMVTETGSGSINGTPTSSTTVLYVNASAQAEVASLTLDTPAGTLTFVNQNTTF